MEGFGKFLANDKSKASSVESPMDRKCSNRPKASLKVGTGVSSVAWNYQQTAHGAGDGGVNHSRRRL